MTAIAPRVRVLEALAYERPVVLRLPFRFGAATVTRCGQAYVRAVVEVDGRATVGAAAELMVPKWFDKNPALTHEQNAEQLRTALRVASDAAVEAGTVRSAHALSLEVGEAAMHRAAALGLPRLAAQFGPAQVDKAVADAVLRATGLSWCAGLRAGVLGDPWSAALPIAEPMSVALRHTVGLADRLADDELAADPAADPRDGLPATLERAVGTYGLTHFKLKLCGRVDDDVARLASITSVLQRHAPANWRATLDGNESYADADTLAAAWRRFADIPALAELLRRTLLLEQPLPRALALRTPVRDLGIGVPMIIDESDDHPEAFDEALALGYRGVSSKACKGLYRSLQHAARIAREPGLVLSGEDLTCQAGLAVQQDTLLAASLGVAHIERNGHHYVDGFGAAPADEAQAWADAHAGFYDPATRRLAVHDGRLDLTSLHAPGFASRVQPHWPSLTPMG
ncbi:MAG: hypothetical protein JNN18_01740 [Rubrivivax sp.]|nr:hypothetical protein [Rubrivivax sp.]